MITITQKHYNYLHIIVCLVPEEICKVTQSSSTNGLDMLSRYIVIIALRKEHSWHPWHPFKVKPVTTYFEEKTTSLHFTKLSSWKDNFISAPEKFESNE